METMILLTTEIMEIHGHHLTIDLKGQRIHHQEVGQMMRIIEIRKMRKAPLIANLPKVPLPAALPEAHRARIDPEGRNPVRSRESRRLTFLYERAGKISKNWKQSSKEKVGGVDKNSERKS